MSTFQAFDELWWFYLCRIQEKHRTFDKARAVEEPEAALGRLERELLAHHPVYYRTIWFLATVNLLVEAGELVDLADRRLAAAIKLARELSRDAGDRATWRNALANGIVRMTLRGGATKERSSRDRTWILSQYISLIEEFHGSAQGRTFFLWASAFRSPQRRKVTIDGHRTYLPSRSELESRRDIGTTLFIGAGHYLELLSKSHDILLGAQSSAPDSFSSALWAFEADSLFDPSKVAMAKSIHHGNHDFFAGNNASVNRERLLQGGPALTMEEAKAHETLLATRESKARMVASEGEWRGLLEREQLFGRAREEEPMTEDA